MAKCPKCGTSDAYVGFSSIECKNKDCEHFVLEEKKTCACCGAGDHSIEHCTNTLSEQYDDSGGNGPPSMYSAGQTSSPPPDWHGDGP